jgi:hypothetical protein
MSYARYFILILVLFGVQSCGTVERSLNDKDFKEYFAAIPPQYTEKDIRVIVEQVDNTDLLRDKLKYKGSSNRNKIKNGKEQKNFGKEKYFHLIVKENDLDPFSRAFKNGFNNVFTVVESGEAYDLIITPEIVDYKLNIVHEKIKFEIQYTTWIDYGRYVADIVFKLTVTDSNKKKIAEITETKKMLTESSGEDVLTYGQNLQTAMENYYAACSEANHELAKYLVPLMVNELLDNNGFRVYAEEKKLK